MFKIILTEDRMVIGCSDNLQFLSDGIVATSPTQRYAKSAYSNIVEVDTLPADYEDYKYNYVEGVGFVKNEEWVDTDAPIIDIKALKRENELLKNSLLELTSYIAQQDVRLETQEQAILELSTLISGGIA
ncbi:hypothetical protein [Bacillus sp. FJAT-49736]|uniref:hypothetical protein n=1 Tax=Bacillus sp. FJAT-49736 TaxID=2833582 RepID=UPI001BC9AEF9|nr:hypothetical protein [Bacillus sp. FJAT-49736]MBS4172136.1 hypothetical protein [Bacillus sp. FJAT-49736]